MQKKKAKKTSRTTSNVNFTHTTQNVPSTIVENSRSQKDNSTMRGINLTNSATSSEDGSTTNRTTVNDNNSYIYILAKLWMGLPAKIIGIISPSIILIVLGINSVPQSIPLFSFIERYQAASLVIGGVLALMTLLALVITRHQPNPENGDGRSAKSPATQNRPWAIATAISTTCFLLSSGLLVILLIRPDWCHRPFCPDSYTPPAQGTSDANLEMYPQAVVSTSFVIPGDPASYSQPNPPQSIGAVLIDGKTNVPSNYYVVMNVESLQDRYDIVIERIDLKLTGLPPIPCPLNIWSANPDKTSSANPYSAAYRNERSGGTILSTSISQPVSLVSLAPGEKDQFKVQVSSRVPVYLQFRMQVTYTLSNGESGMLTSKQIFEVIFSTPANWNAYQLHQGHFVRQSQEKQNLC